MLEAATPVRYVVSFPAPLTHYAEVRAVIPTGGKSTVELFLPVWTPGSYLVREYSRHIEAVSGTGTRGNPLAIHKTRKNRWRVNTEESDEVELRYRVYCREMSVRTNWVDEDFALLNGAATFLTEVGNLNREHIVEIALPPAWKRSVSGLRETTPNRFIAPDYDTLVDSPILAGNPAVHEFEVGGKKHFLVNQGETTLWDGARSARDVERIVEQNLKLWGSLPYDRYVFLNLIVDAGGGLEHKNSMTIMSGRYATRTRKAYVSWLGLVSHEFFHVWNVKRLRPAELGPFDYEDEVYTHNLWIAEGFTEYYGGLIARRSGLLSDVEYLGAGAHAERWPGSLSALLEALQTTPGRMTQPLEQASFDAWIKAYRPDENSGNTSISYYVKGAMVAWLLDAKIRAATGGEKSLDDFMRAAYSRYSGERGYSAQEMVSLASEIAGHDLGGWFDRVLLTGDELDFDEALQWFGLEFRKVNPPRADHRPKAWTGFQTKPNGGRLLITQIPRNTPGETGFSVDDELLAVDGWRVTPETWAQRLEQYAPGDQIEITVSRRERLLRIPTIVGEEPARKWQLQMSAEASPEQRQHLTSWLSGNPQARTTASEPAQ